MSNQEQRRQKMGASERVVSESLAGRDAATDHVARGIAYFSFEALEWAQDAVRAGERGDARYWIGYYNVVVNAEREGRS